MLRKPHVPLGAAFTFVAALLAWSGVAGQTGRAASLPALPGSRLILGPNSIVAPPLNYSRVAGVTSKPLSLPQPALPGPRRNAYDVSGPRLYVTDWFPVGSQYGRVYVLNPAKNDPTPLATITDGISTPTVACLDSKGVLYVLNSHAKPLPKHGWVSEYLPGHTHPSLILREGISVPYGCAIDAHDNLYVSNWGGINVIEYKHGQMHPSVVLNQSNGLFAPYVIALDSTGNLYVVNNNFTGSANIQVFAPGATQPTATITDGAWWPQGIAVDSHDTLYVSNFPTQRQLGAISEYHNGQTAPFQMMYNGNWYPWGLTLDKRGRLFVSIASGSLGEVLEYAPGSLHPSKKSIALGVSLLAGMDYWPAVLP